MDTAPSDRARALLAPLLAAPQRAAVLTDFDGTLASIVAEPSAAAALPGAAESLSDLAGTFGRVAVISGRPVSFLVDRLPGLVGTAVELVGLYGLEAAGPDGAVRDDPEVARWRPAVADAAGRLADGAPDGVLVEVKGAAVTVHWRAAPAFETWVAGAVAAEADRTGLVAHPARLSLELRPPLAIDKGTVVAGRCVGMDAACYLGDDVGDVPAFDALAAWSAGGGGTAVRIAVEDEETDPTVRAAADLVVPGPESAVGLLRWLADAGRA
jgi:trehalose 6-phosphate phosphatase